MQKRMLDLREEFRAVVREFRCLLEAAREVRDMREKISLQRNAMTTFNYALALNRELATTIDENLAANRRPYRKLRG